MDCFIEAALEAKQLDIGPEADRLALVAASASTSPDCRRRWPKSTPGLATPPRMPTLAWWSVTWPVRITASAGQILAHTAGLRDSNGYFDADTNRPLAYRYREDVVRSFNSDKPYDRFVTEQARPATNWWAFAPMVT